MKKYYLMAINKYYTKSMYNLANYYKDIEKDYGQMIIYFLMAIEQNDHITIIAMNEPKNKLKFYNLLYNLIIKTNAIAIRKMN